jgi:three-Cys-motif partner protein
MVDDFFKAKRSWSQYKDLILGYYLEPYIPKVNTLRKPILIVDCFAGPGKFEDGKPGSPLIICATIKKWHDKGVPVRGIFIEHDDEGPESNYAKLERLLEQFHEFATPRRGKFEQHLPELAELARRNTVFLYVDPYVVRNLLFEEMRRVYQQIQKASASVEVLINFNASDFLRWGLAALKRQGHLGLSDAPLDEDDESYVADQPTPSIELAELNSIAGGEYWQAIALNASVPFTDKLEQLMQGYSKLMAESFNWVCWYGVKAKYHHKVPKYYLLYATRSDDGIELMNDAMCKARREFVKHEFPQDGTLFDMTPTSETVDLVGLSNELMELAPDDTDFTRLELRLTALQNYFGRYSTKDYTAAVAALLKSRRLFSRSGRSRINDQEPLSKQAF